MRANIFAVNFSLIIYHMFEQRAKSGNHRLWIYYFRYFISALVDFRDILTCKARISEDMWYKWGNYSNEFREQNHGRAGTRSLR